MGDMFGQNSDGEVEDDQDEDTQWRMKRFEREQWLKENKKVSNILLVLFVQQGNKRDFAHVSVLLTIDIIKEH